MNADGQTLGQIPSLRAECAGLRDERDALKADVEQMRALVGHYGEVAAGILSHGLPVHCAECRKGLLEIAGDADGQQAVQVWDALLEVAEAAQAWEDRRKAYAFGAQEVMEAEAWLCVALDGLRGVRDGKEEQDGHGPCEAD